MTGDEYHTIGREMGKLVKPVLDELVNSPAWRSTELNDERRAKLLEDAMRKVHDLVAHKTIVMGKRVLEAER